jgi:hypothetical protein
MTLENFIKTSRSVSFLFGSDSFNDQLRMILNTSSVYLRRIAAGYDGHLGYPGYMGWHVTSAFGQTLVYAKIIDHIEV